MSLTTSLSSTLKEQLPPCLEPMRQQIVQMMGSLSFHKYALFTKVYKPIGAWSGYRMKTEIDHSMEILTSTGKKVVEKAARTLFRNEDYKPGIEGIHYWWEEKGLTCESLTVSGAQEVITDCYQGPFTDRLLSHVCTDEPTILNELLFPYERPQDLLASTPLGQTGASWSYANMAGAGIGVIAGIKVVQNLWNGNKSRALLWAGVGVASLAAIKI